MLKRKYWLIPLVIVIAIAAFSFLLSAPAVSYNTDIKPILNKKCITCHGGVKKKGGFSLLFRDEALDTTESGKRAIVPGDPDASEMIRRLTLKDDDERMPYHKEPLSEHEINLLRRWIKEGAKWGDHWAYVPVQQQKVPEQESFFGLISKKDPWVKNDIDAFIRQKLEENKLKPTAEADKRTLLRRVSLDLTGLPAPKKIADQFLGDTSSEAYERLVDTLLALPQYGERWTAMWLDLSRYADTKGYERDDSRSIWRYRDWLIKAFNEDKPYNQFLTEQLAGDLLPNATDEQILATAFHRNSMTNDEGGTDNEEFRIAAIIDRVNTTWEVLMGSTFACVQCHSHPYDPFKHDEYYKFMAYFNNSRDEDTYADYPLFHEYKKKDSTVFEKLKSWSTSNLSSEDANEITWFLKTWQPAINGLTADQFVNSELSDTKWLLMRKTSSARLNHIDLTNKNQMLIRYMAWPKDGELTLCLDSLNGTEIAKIKIPKANKGWDFLNSAITPTSGIHDVYLKYYSKELKKEIDNGLQFDWFYFTNPFPGKDKPGFDSASSWYDSLLRSPNVEITPVMLDNPDYLKRKQHVFVRGNWMVSGDEVTPGVPGSLTPLPENAPANRLGLAAWITDPKNPLTARTMVNRLWEQIFGQGLVETLEDMGTQGIPPTHRELLDHLSWQFVHEYNWSVKKLVKEMVMSATYRQDSRVSKELLQQDQFNKWYARGPRVRLSAEQIRDQALEVSGLLSKKMYGKSVMPYQPGGIWLSPYNGRLWIKSYGEDQYRRALYTYWKRTAPYPSMISFDGAAREVCTARRVRTNTPLQALTTLNDSVYVEASRHLACDLRKEYKDDVKKMISAGYEKIAGKPIPSNRYLILERLYNTSYIKFKADSVSTCEMIGIQNEFNEPVTAAMVVVTNAMLNLDEVITKN
ncbi:DUF1553 domain-containing protein [Pollutibacter soli]|uniref:DUF1553 domain-containing protein n=1 Tax=Pollutibacter soli TaxID=3034157 RepID=UPI0030138BFB